MQKLEQERVRDELSTELQQIQLAAYGFDLLLAMHLWCQKEFSLLEEKLQCLPMETVEVAYRIGSAVWTPVWSFHRQFGSLRAAREHRTRRICA